MINFKYDILTTRNQIAEILTISDVIDEYDILNDISSDVEMYFTMDVFKKVLKQRAPLYKSEIILENTHRFIPKINHLKISNNWLSLNPVTDSIIFTKKLLDRDGKNISCVDVVDLTDNQWIYLYKKAKSDYIDYLKSYEKTYPYRENIIYEYLMDLRRKRQSNSKLISLLPTDLVLGISHYDGYNSHLLYEKDLVSISRYSNLGFGFMSFDKLIINIDQEEHNLQYSNNEAISQINRVISAGHSELLEMKKEIILKDISRLKEMLTKANTYISDFIEKSDFSYEERNSEFNVDFDSFQEYNFREEPIEKLKMFIKKLSIKINQRIEDYKNCKLSIDDLLEPV